MATLELRRIFRNGVKTEGEKRANAVLTPRTSLIGFGHAHLHGLLCL